MKIVIATAVYYPMVNGVAVFSHNLAVGLVKRGHEVVVLTPSQTGRKYTRVEEGVRVIHLKSTTVKVYPDQVHTAEPRRFLGREWAWYRHGFKVSVFPGREVRKVLGDFRPDVVHVQVSDPIGLSVVGYARGHGIPVVTTEHNQPEVITEPLGMPGVVRKPVEALLSAYFANRQSKSDYVTMPTKMAIEKLLDGKKFEVPVEAVSNGVDLSQFSPGKADDETYARYKVRKHFKTLLTLGRLDPEKNVGVVIEAFLAAREKMAEAQLVIVGDGVDRARLEKMAKGCSDIHFLGRITGEELARVYRLGDVFVTASEIETQGIVLIEAAATGLPLIAVKAGAVSEICRNGENGILCRAGDVGGMAQAMVKLLSDGDLRRKMKARSIEIAKEHDFEKTLDKFEEIYAKVVRRETRDREEHS